jgi:hypothetical protein
MINPAELQQYWEKGISFQDFLDQINLLHQENKVTGHTQNQELLDYSLLNEHRMNRIIKQGKQYPINGTKAGLNRILVITEGWCGDSAQTLPFIFKWSSLQKVELRIVGRDDYPELMDQFLTNGSRSIPVMIGLNDNFNVLFQWGPRPSELVVKMEEWKGQGIVKPELGQLMHQWYAKNAGESAWTEWEQL